MLSGVVYGFLAALGVNNSAIVVVLFGCGRHDGRRAKSVRYVLFVT
jgi:hypothetical protein